MRKIAPNRRITVHLLSPHPLVLEEFHRLVSSSGFRLRTQRLESTLPPDLLRMVVGRAQVYVVDAQIPRPAVEALVAGILARYSAARLLVVAEAFSEAEAFPLLRMGAKGLLSYGEAQQHLSQAVQMVAGGGFWVPRSLLSRFVDSILNSVQGRRLKGGPADLSRREHEVLDALLENQSNKEIASKLYISERTVKFHVSNLLAKFGVRRRADLILHRYQNRPAGS